MEKKPLAERYFDLAVSKPIWLWCLVSMTGYALAPLGLAAAIMARGALPLPPAQ